MKEPFIRIVKKAELGKRETLILRLEALLLALVAGGLFILSLGHNPFAVYWTIINGALRSQMAIQATVKIAIPLLIASLGVTLAFKMRFWNIGAEGQIIMGGIFASYFALFHSDWNHWLLILVMFLAGALGGGLWGLIPAWFKTKFDTNETLFTLMLNYVAMQIVTFCIVYWENPAGSNTVGIINSATRAGWLPELGGLTYGWNVVIVLVFTIGMYIYMKYSKQGYEVAVVGESQDTARYARINVKRTIIRTMGISGGICGVAGFLLVSGASHTISTSTAGGRGFTAIIVAWLSKFNAFVMILVSFFLVFMEKGAIQIASQFNLNENASDVITGIILFFILGSEFFIRYRIAFTKAHK